jgi:ATP-dependent Clp protease ATP-binding subunit ClpA
MSHPSVGPEHLLLALLRDDRGPAAEAFEAVGVSFAAARREVRRLYGEPEEGGEARAAAPPAPISSRAREALERAAREAESNGRAVGVEHVLLGVLRDPQGGGVQVLAALGVPPPISRTRSRSRSRATCSRRRSRLPAAEFPKTEWARADLESAPETKGPR